MPETTSAQEVPWRITASRRETPTQRKTRGQIPYEDKVEVLDTTREVQGRELREQENLEWNTDLMTWTMARHTTNPENLKLTNANIHMNARGAVDETREHQFNEKRLVSSTARPHEPRRCA